MRRVGLEDRDWYREEPSKSWRGRWGGPGNFSTRRSSPTGSGVRVRPRAWLAIAVSAAAIVATSQFGFFEIPLVGSSRAPAALPPTPSVTPQPVGEAAPSVEQSPPPPVPDASKTVRLGTSPGFDVPATRVSRWSVTGSRFGTVSVIVPVGTTPRDALVIALAERGFQVTG